jgi:hypothetical protein
MMANTELYNLGQKQRSDREVREIVFKKLWHIYQSAKLQGDRAAEYDAWCALRAMTQAN